MIRLWSARAITAVLVLGPYGVAFFAATWLFRLPEASTMFERLKLQGLRR